MTEIAKGIKTCLISYFRYLQIRMIFGTVA